MKLEIDGKPRQIANLIFRLYRKKPVLIRAIQINRPFRVQTLEGIMEGKAGDFLIIGVKGEAYPCDYDIFQETYEREDVKKRKH